MQMLLVRHALPVREVNHDGTPADPPLSEVGRAFGGKDHTTVLHAVDKIQALLQEDPKLRKQVDGLIQGITL